MFHIRKDYNRIQDPDGKIPDDEPVFLIRGQDKVAAKVVEYYAMCAAKEGADLELVNMCHKQARNMREWNLKHVCKIPDLPRKSLSERL